MEHQGTKNLKPIKCPERAREMQRKGVESRLEKKRIAEEQAERIQAEKERLIALSQLADEGLSAHEILRANMIAAQLDGDRDGATKIAKDLAEYEKPKMTRSEVTTTVRSVKDLSEEELEEIAGLKTELKVVEGGKS